uniref:Uncharacterized protein n=1 Tax=Tanacetum cinerariifolium TaxID=118510 RepID=A0A6L2LKK4_TANCI|nr:hypothetical protein [Tanacetum cinerariifolium]
MEVTQLVLISLKWSVTTVTRWDIFQESVDCQETKIAGAGIKIALEGLSMWKKPLPRLWLLLMELVLTEAIWLKMRDSEISGLKCELEKLKKEKESTQLKLKNFDQASKSLDKLIGSQLTDKSKKGEFQQPEFQRYGPKSYETESWNASKEIPNELKESLDSPLVKNRVSDNKDCTVESSIVVEKKTVVPTVAKIEFVKAKQQEKPVRKPIKPRPDTTARPNSVVANHVRESKSHPQQVQEDQGYVDSGCSRHMIGNMSYLSYFKEFHKGYVTFGGGENGGRITGKGTIHTGINSNDFVGIEEHIGQGHSSKETRSSQDYILMPLWKDGLLFDSFSKNPTIDEPQSSCDAENKDDKSVNKDCGIDAYEKSANIINDDNTVGPTINNASTDFDTGSLNINTVSPTVSIASPEATHADFLGDQPEGDMSNINTTYQVPYTLNTRIHKDHSLDLVIGDVQSGVMTRKMTKTTYEQVFISTVYEEKTHEDLNTCLFTCFLSQIEPTRVSKALTDPAWVEAMQEELLQNKKDERCIVIKNKARLVTQGYAQEEGIDYDEVFAPVVRIKAIRVFLALASFMGFMVYQIDVKSVFLYGRIEKGVCVCQPLGFEDPDHPDKVYKVVKALYGLHQALRAWYETLAKYLLDNGFHRGKIDQTLFIKRQNGDILLVHVYMSSVDELTFFLGLQVKKKEDEIFICQDKYVTEVLRKFNLSDAKTASTPVDIEKPLVKDADGDDVDVHLYRSMIGSLMYLIASRPDIMYAVCVCARFQVTPKVSHLHAVKRIFRYLKGHFKFGLWYPRDSLFELVAYTDSDYAGASLDNKSTTGGY